MQFLFAPIWGGISDRAGRRPIIILGISGSVVSYTLFAIAALYGSFAGLLISRIGAGIAGATIPTAQAYIADTTSKENRTRGMALIGIAFGLGFAFGPVFAWSAIRGSGGDLGAGPGFLAAGFSFIALLLAIFKLPEPTRHVARERAAWWSLTAWKTTFSNRALTALITGFFMCLFAFSLYESSLSVLLKGSPDFKDRPFDFSYQHVVMTFAAIGFLAAFYQGAVVRPLTRRFSNGVLATTGAAIEAIGFGVMALATFTSSVAVLWTSILIIGAGYGFLQPTLFAMLSRWSDPGRQGATLGIGQSAGSMARIVGALFAFPLIKYRVQAPYLFSSGLMLIGLVAILFAIRYGRDFPDENAGSFDEPAHS
jgi:MFS family permease